MQSWKDMIQEKNLLQRNTSSLPSPNPASIKLLSLHGLREMTSNDLLFIPPFNTNKVRKNVV
jgi:hypothetical protein